MQNIFEVMKSLNVSIDIDRSKRSAKILSWEREGEESLICSEVVSSRSKNGEHSLCNP